jgi:hypothetical protein
MSSRTGAYHRLEGFTRTRLLRTSPEDEIRNRTQAQPILASAVRQGASMPSLPQTRSAAFSAMSR